MTNTFEKIKTNLTNQLTGLKIKVFLPSLMVTGRANSLGISELVLIMPTLESTTGALITVSPLTRTPLTLPLAVNISDTRALHKTLPPFPKIVPIMLFTISIVPSLG